MNPNVPDSDPPITTIAIAATFTAEPVEAALRFWMQELQIPAKIAFAPYSQVFQQLVDPSSLFSGNRYGVNVVIVRLEDLIPAEASREGPASFDTEGFLSAVKGAVERSAIPHLVFFCPGDPPLDRSVESRIAEALRGLPGVQVVTGAELLSAYPVAEAFDPAFDRQAHVPYTPAFYTALGTMIARKIYGLNNPPYKVIAVDADQTLWNGVCGEDGPDGVGIDASRRAIQEFLVRQHDAGMILCLCSKNNEEDVAAVFDRRPDMFLRREHFVGWRVNWSAKSGNLRSLADELQLGLESFIFLDDDVVVRADVEANCPPVLTLALPANPGAIAPFLSRIWAFDHGKATKEASDRTAFYRQNAERREFQMESLTLKEFLTGLKLKIQILPIAPDDLARTAELTQRTNQFNVTTIRRSEAGLQSLLQPQGPQGPQGLDVRVRDRFGDYGLVGAMIFAFDSEALVVDTFLLSCRALGRGVEHRMLARLGEIALQNGLSSVEVPFRPSGKNQPALDFLENAGADRASAAGDGFLFRFPAHRAAAMRYDPPSGQARESAERLAGPAPAGAPVDARPRAALLSSIATELSDAGQLTALIAAQRLSRPDLNVPYVAPATDTEKRLAGMFEELLGVDRVGMHDNFFSLGGHSLLAMMLINRVRDAFHVEFPIAVLFDAEFTVAKAAQTVARFQNGDASPEGTPEALDRLLETLSDDEVRVLLAEQGSPVPGKSGPEKA